MKYKGSAQDLETIVTALGRNINSSKEKGNMHQIKTDEGETINLYTTGTLLVQASHEIKQKFEDDFNHYNGTPQPAVKEESNTSTPAVKQK